MLPDAGPAGKDVYFPRVTEPGSGARPLEAKPYLVPLLEPCLSKPPAAMGPAPPGAQVVNLATHSADFGALPSSPLASTALGGLTPERLIKWSGAGELGGPGAAARGP